MRTLTRLLAILLAALLLASAAPARRAAGQDDARDPMADLVLSAGELSAAAEKGTIFDDDNQLLPAAPSRGRKACWACWKGSA